MIALIIMVALFPGLFTQVEPNNNCQLANSDGAPAAGHPLGFTFQGCDVYSRIIHGTQASLMVGVFSVLFVVIIGVTLGALAGFYGGWLDAVIARLGDIFFALPLVLGALVVSQLPFMRDNRGVWTVVLILVALGWPQMARITRGAVIEVRNADFVTAARSLGVSRIGSLVRHVLPNALAPIIVLATMELGVFIVAEATLSFIGIGLPGSIMSWGNDIAARQVVRPHQPGHPAVPGHGAVRHRPELYHARRRPARRPRPEEPSTMNEAIMTTSDVRISEAGAGRQAAPGNPRPRHFLQDRFR